MCVPSIEGMHAQANVDISVHMFIWPCCQQVMTVVVGSGSMKRHFNLFTFLFETTTNYPKSTITTTRKKPQKQQ